MKIEEGKFYKTLCGCKVGPMRLWDRGCDHSWVQSNRRVFNQFGDLWRDDGTSDYSPDLVYEWVDEETGPVREVTVTRKEIVDGYYGAVCVENGGARVSVSVMSDAQDIRNAISVLTQIADAMEDEV